jgi:hypothetical protein
MTKHMKLNENGKLVVEKPTAEQVKLDKVTETYVKIRDARSVLKKEYEAKDGELKAQLETLDGFLLGRLQDLGVESVRTKHGTVYQSVTIKPSCGDWGAFGDWIIENNVIDALERRVKKSFIADYMADNKGSLPPGISVQQEYTVTIRRS